MTSTIDASMLRRATKELKKLCDANGIDASHGVDHASNVLRHVNAALQEAKGIDEERAFAVRLAALLHDADDRKYFPKTVGHPNAEKICRDIGASENVIKDVSKMIGWVSCSENGNAVPEEARRHPELLWPRWSDRLEAVGEIGLARCYVYNCHSGSPLYIETTPRPKTEEEAFESASPERFATYQKSGGSSASMMDHFYDKLLSVARPPPSDVQNTYLEREALKRVAPLLNVCLVFGRTGNVPVDTIEDICKKHGLRVPDRK